MTNGQPEPIWRYLIAVGSNQRHHRIGGPPRLIAAAARLLGNEVRLLARAPVMLSRPIGPSRRQFANSAWLIETTAMPQHVLCQLQEIEQRLGRRRRGQRWSARVIDLDIILWSGGIWASKSLSIPHPHWRDRPFVAGPLAQLAPDWHDPVTHHTVRQIAMRQRRSRAQHGD